MAKPQMSGEPLLELYRNTNFVASSITSVYARRSKITKNGEIVIESIGNVKDRHLIAAPTLPSLETRVSKSTNKNLYELSVQLADESENSSEQSSNPDPNIGMDCQEAMGQQVNNKATNKLGQRSPLIPASSLKKPLQWNKAPEVLRESRYLPNQLKLTPKPQERQVNLCARPVTQPTKQPKIPEFNKENQNKPNRAEVQPVIKSTERSEIPEINQETRNIKHKAEVQPYLRVDPAGSIKYVSVKEVLKALTLEQMRLIWQFIDDNHLYSLIILLGTLIYLGYILFYDISEPLNSEQRYLAKLRDSYLPMRCFYYAMRLLRVPIF